MYYRHFVYNAVCHGTNICFIPLLTKLQHNSAVTLSCLLFASYIHMTHVLRDMRIHLALAAEHNSIQRGTVLNLVHQAILCIFRLSIRRGKWAGHACVELCAYGTACTRKSCEEAEADQ